MVRNSSVLGVVGDYSQHSTLSPLSKMIKEGKQLLKSAEVYIMAKEISSNVFAKRVLEIPEHKVTQNATAYPNSSSYIDLNIALQINRLRIPPEITFLTPSDPGNAVKWMPAKWTVTETTFTCKHSREKRKEKENLRGISIRFRWEREYRAIKKPLIQPRNLRIFPVSFAFKSNQYRKHWIYGVER